MGMDFSLHGRTALVSGATQGIGRAAAIALAACGARVVISGRNDEGVARTLGELPGDAGVKHETLLTDHADPAAVEKEADRLVSRIGEMHIVVVNSGGPAAGFLIDAPTEEIEKSMKQHLATAHKLAQVAAPGMRGAKYGRIIAVGSTSVERPIRGLGVSNVVRSAMANWTRALAGELGGFGITANMVMPGATRTPRLQSIIAGRAQRAGHSPQEIEAAMIRKIPAGRFGAAEEIAAVIAFLASPAAGYINGAVIPVDGGLLCTQG